LATTPTLTTPILGVATATSLALGGASIGSNALAVTGTSAFAGTTNSGSMLVSGTSAPSLSNGNATVYASSVNGGIHSGQGSTNDVSLENKSGVIAANIPTGTTNFNIVGTLSFGTLSSTSLGASPTTITGLTLDGSIVANNDYLMVYSASSGAILKATVASIVSSGVAGVSSLNGLTGGLSIVAGTDIAVVAASSSVTVNFAIPGSSTGVTSFSSPNSGATNYVIAVPAANDTMALTGTAQTFTAVNSFNTGDLVINGGTATAGLASVTSGGVVSSCAACTLATSLTVPQVYGGTAAGSTLALVSTSNGSPSGDSITLSAGGGVLATLNSTGLGLGASPSYLFQVQNTSTATSGTVEASNITQNMNPAGSSSATVFAGTFVVNMSANQNETGSLIAFKSYAQNSGTGTTSNMSGAQYIAFNSSTGTCTQCWGLETYVNNNGGGTATQAVSLYVKQPTGATTGLTSVWTNTYGLYIQDQNPSGAGTNTLTNPPAAIYITSQTATGAFAIEQVGSGLNSFAGATSTFSASTVSSSTTTGTVVITGGVGIGGIEYLGGALHVAGNVFFTGLTAGSGTAALCLNSTGSQVESDTSATICGISALRYKNIAGEISPNSALAGIVTLRTDFWRYKPDYQDHGKDEHVGPIADDVERMDPRCGQYDDNGKLYNYQDRCIEGYLIGSVKALKVANDNLEMEIRELKYGRAR
jgi:hypothetical protein